MNEQMNKGIGKGALFAWLLAATYYFYQYALRSAPSVMMPQLSEAFGVNALGVASIVGMFYYGYSPFSLVAGAAMDRFGAKRIIPIGAALVGAGALLFSTGSVVVASVGRFLQGAGGVFALVGAIYIATKYFPASYAASLIGATQMFGMAGGSAGQFFVGPLITGGLPWGRFWIYAGFVGLAISVSLLVLLPEGRAHRPRPAPAASASVLGSLKTVFSNPQSILCGLIAGLLFIPTTIFDMTWGVRFLQEGRGREYEDAVRIAAAVPFGWMIGCPLLGFISDRIGRRKPVILGGALVLLAVLAWVLFGVPGIFRGAGGRHRHGHRLGRGDVAVHGHQGSQSAGAGRLGHRRDQLHQLHLQRAAGSGVRRAGWSQCPEGSERMALEHYQAAFKPMLFGIVAAVILTCLLKETGPAARRSLAMTLSAQSHRRRENR